MKNDLWLLFQIKELIKTIELIYKIIYVFKVIAESNQINKIKIMPFEYSSSNNGFWCCGKWLLGSILWLKNKIESINL